MPVDLKACFSDPLLNVMLFLSEVTLDHPDAISFATGSPQERFFDVQASLDSIRAYVEYRAEATGLPQDVVLNNLGQYDRTNGIINDLLVRHLAIDENIHVPPHAIMVTSGYQEAAAVIMMGLFEASQDVLLVSDPSYIGVTPLARILGVPVVSVPVSDDGFHVDALLAAMTEVRQSGKRPRAFYEVPDFNNPLGTSMPVATRLELLDALRANDMLIIEDNPYGMFAYDGERLPTLKSLDKNNSVLYIGTFSKTLFPNLRIGYLVADQPVQGTTHLLAEELSKVKGVNTVNTSSLLQAAVGGLLLGSNYSLSPLVRAKLPFYRANRDRMVACLNEEFGMSELRGLVRWQCPSGGFFLAVTLPFIFDEECFRTCASEYGLLCCPMSFFSLGHARDNQLRLSFSYVTPEQIDEGIRRLARFVRDRLRV